MLDDVAAGAWGAAVLLAARAARLAVAAQGDQLGRIGRGNR